MKCLSILKTRHKLQKERKIMKISLNKNHINEMAKISIAVIVFFSITLHFTLSTDSYWIFNKGFESAAEDHLFRSGRPIFFLIYKLIAILKIPNSIAYYVLTVLALIFLILAIWFFQDMIREYIINENIRLIICFSTIVNIFIVEFFEFLEKCGFMLVILFSVLAVRHFNSYLIKRKLTELILTIFYAILIMYSYQGLMSLFVIVSFPFIYKQSRTIKDYFINLFVLGAIYLTIAVSYLVFYKIVATKAMFIANRSLIDSVKYVAYRLFRVFIYTFDVLKPFVFVCLLLSFVIIYIYCLCKTQEKSYRLIHFIIFSLAIVIVPCAPVIQGSGYIVMRTIYPIASCFGLILIDIYINYDIEINSLLNKLKRSLLIMLSILEIVFCFSFNGILSDLMKMNYADQNRALYIGEKISEYESESNNTIKYVAYYYDADIEYPTYPELYCDGDGVTSFFYTNWSNIDGLNYYLNRNFKKASPKEEFIDYFGKLNWSVLSDKQFIFENDTIHICLY